MSETTMTPLERIAAMAARVRRAQKHWERFRDGATDNNDQVGVLIVENERLNAEALEMVPELYGALEAAEGLAIAWMAHYQYTHGLPEPHPTHQKIVDDIRAALAKARGQQS